MNRYEIKSIFQVNKIIHNDNNIVALITKFDITFKKYLFLMKKPNQSHDSQQ